METSNRLPVLAAEIRTALDAVRVATETATRHAINAGYLLIEAKETCKHGEWLPWLTKHCALSERSAQGYMRLARKYGEMGEAKAQRVADLAIRQALKAVADEAPSVEHRMISHAAELRRSAGAMDDIGDTEMAARCRAAADVAEELAVRSLKATTLEDFAGLANDRSFEAVFADLRIRCERSLGQLQ